MIEHWLPELFVVLSFLMGSIPFGVFVARFYGVNDIKSEGSGNIGATNVARVAGFWPAGFLTLFFDILKGIVIILPLQQGWLPLEGFEPSSELLWSVGLAAVLGHCFTPWLRFRGGKGVATSYGVLIVLAPFSGLVGVLAFLLAFLSTKIGSVGSLTGLVLAGALHLVFYPLGPYVALLAAMILLIIYRHDSNLDALLEKRENSF